ncbi:calponin homology domain-containing protein [Phycomyces nitens]|nr:calponin homology domain-containing protein [Phycomyces nitens]
MNNAWEAIQQKTFTKWVNNKLDIRQVPHIKELCADLATGVRLIQLLEIIGNAPIPRYNKNPRMRIQCVENVNMALEFIRRIVPLTNIGAEDIVDKNLKLVLGMLWTIILRFTIDDINQEGKNAKEGLLLWCQRKTAPYSEVDVRDFTYSWTDGLAFCALIHCHRPDLLDFSSLDPNDRHGNTALAFDIAEEYLGIPKLLDVEDVCDISKPDERSVMTYVAEYFHAFSTSDKVGTAGRRISKFAEVMSSIWQMQHTYEERVLALMDAVDNAQQNWKETILNDSYDDMKQLVAEFTHYKSTQKRDWISEKRDLDLLLGNIQTKLKTYNLKPYFPREGLTLKDLDNMWYSLLQDEALYHQSVNSRIRRIKENHRKAFANAANDFQHQLDTISAELASLEGDLEFQLNRLNLTKRKVDPLEILLHNIEGLDQECIHANTEENDYTVYSVEDLAFGLELVQQAIQKKNAFIQNQVVSRNMTSLTPAQLEQFEQTFRHFDTNCNNTLSPVEFNASLASLGIFFKDSEFISMFRAVAEGRDEITFEQFIRFIVSVTEDKSTPQQLHDSFRAIAGEKPYVTELDLSMCLVPAPFIDYLKHAMPQSREEPGALDYNSYVMQTFI